MQINIFKGDRASDGARALQVALGATMLRSVGSVYSGRRESCVINWGSTSPEAVRLEGVCDTAGRTFFNNPGAVNCAVDKLRFFRLMQATAPQYMIPWADNYDDAAKLVHAGGRVFARTVLTGHSGKGIELLVSPRDAELEVVRQVSRSELLPVTILGVTHPTRELIAAKLFTQGITGKRIEYRVHVFNGRVILTQAKLRKEGYQANPKYNSIVRNVDSGWIYGVNNVPEVGIAKAGLAAIASVSILGLDFGAVDVVYQEGTDKAFVLEVNTAPGLEEGGSALEAYTQAFSNFQ